MAEPIALKYRAFISYSHADTDWAKWLHRGLESFRIDKELVGRSTATGSIPPALRPIFRDRDDFTAGHTLNEQTLAALDASAALVVICSPASAKSLYVNEEIKLFKSRHPDRPVIPLIVDGKPDDRERKCFPPALEVRIDAKGRLGKKRIELLAADAREESDGKDLALAKVIAGLLGLSSDDVFRRAERERRAATRRRRRVQALVGGLALLLIAAGIGWLNQDYLKEQYYWRAVMGPTVLTADQERSLKPGERFSECTGGCPEMVVVPPGKFAMGSRTEERLEYEVPQHEVTIAKPFAVGKYEVTFKNWRACVESGRCMPIPDDEGLTDSQHPVFNVGWHDAQKFVSWLSGLTGKTYRLLSEAEWEYATRAGTTSIFSFDDRDPIDSYAWFDDNAEDKTHPVGQKKPNAFGLYDVHGNAAEWVEDKLHWNYEGAPSGGSPWTKGSEGEMRVVRGGSHFSSASEIRSASRSFHFPYYWDSTTGFRVARTLDQ